MEAPPQRSPTGGLKARGNNPASGGSGSGGAETGHSSVDGMLIPDNLSTTLNQMGMNQRQMMGHLFSMSGLQESPSVSSLVELVKSSSATSLVDLLHSYSATNLASMAKDE